jgi:hypothetical protein
MPAFGRCEKVEAKQACPDSHTGNSETRQGRQQAKRKLDLETLFTAMLEAASGEPAWSEPTERGRETVLQSWSSLAAP